MLRIDSCEPLAAGHSIEVRITFEPEFASAKLLNLHLDTPLTVQRIRANLLDGSLIGLPVQSRVPERDASGETSSWDLGWVDTPIRIVLSIGTIVPANVCIAMLRAEIDRIAGAVPIDVTAEPKFLPQRSRLIVPSEVVSPQDSMPLVVSIVNDGTATARGFNVHLALPSYATLSASNTWRGYETMSNRSLVLPIPMLEVGERAMHQVDVTFDSVIPDGTEIAFRGWVVASGTRFDLDVCTVRVASEALAEVHVRLLEQRAYRVGDRVVALVTARGTGSDVVRDVRVTLPGGEIRWADIDGPVEVTLGDVLPHAEAAAVVHGVVCVAPSGDVAYIIDPIGTAERGEVTAQSFRLDVSGRPRVTAEVSVGSADLDLAHTVHVRVANIGDGDASIVRVAVPYTPGVVGVVDSLAVDGEPRYSIDGSVALYEPGGIDLGVLPVATTRDVSWRVRSLEPQTVELAVDVIADEAAFTSVSRPAVLVDGDRARHTTQADESRLDREAYGAAASSRGDETQRARATVLAEPEAPSEVVAEASGITADVAAEPLVADAPVAADVASVVRSTEADAERPAVEPTPEVQSTVRFEVTPATVRRWVAWFGEHGPNERTERARLVLAAREFLAVMLSGEADLHLTGLRSEVDAVTIARLMSYKSLGMVGASGYDFSTPRMRGCLSSVWSTRGEQRDFQGPGFDSALLELTGGLGTPYGDEITRFRSALLDDLHDLTSLEAYAEPSTDEVIGAARALFASMTSRATTEVAS